jgi:enoyl-CoA hydratase/carnithine racemase
VTAVDHAGGASSTGLPARSVDGLACWSREHVLWLGFDRPRAANAVDGTLATALAGALARAGEDERVRAVVLTGLGGRVFSAGIDVRNPGGLDHEALSTYRRTTVETCMKAILAFDKPLVAAVGGPAVGLGCMLALLADRVLASDTAYLSLPEIDIGIPTFLGVSIVRFTSGAAVARDLVLTGRRLAASEALQRGVIACCVEAAELDAAAQAEARALASKPATTYALAKQWIARGLREDIDAGNARAAEVQPQLEAAARAREAAAGGQDTEGR